jgi:hypothetical protein
MAVRYSYRLLLDNNFDQIMEKLCKGFKLNSDVKLFYIVRQVGEIRHFLKTEKHKAMLAWNDIKADYQKEHKEEKEMANMPTEILESFLETEIALPDKYSKFWPLDHTYFSGVDIDALELPVIEPLMKEPEEPKL